MYKKDCFAFVEKHGEKKCSALRKLECDNCKFYKTKDYYIKYVEPLKNKSGGGCIE